MGLQKSPSFDDVGKEKFAERRVSQRLLRRGLLVAVLLLGTVLLIVGSTQLGSRANEEVGGLDGCVFDGTGNPVLADVIYGDQSKKTYENGCFFFAALPPGKGILVITRGTDTWSYDVEITAGQALLMGEIILK